MAKCSRTFSPVFFLIVSMPFFLALPLMFSKTTCAAPAFDGYFLLSEESLDTQPYGFYDVNSAMDKKGNIFVVYLKTDGTNKLFANKYSSDLKQWDGSVRIDLREDGWPSGDNSGYSSIAIDQQGNAIVVYEQRAKYVQSYQHLYANRYNNETRSWEGPVQIDQFHPLQHLNQGNPLNEKIAFNSYGDALVAFLSDTTKLNIVKYNKASNSWAGGTYDFTVKEIVDILVDENENWVIVLKKGSEGYYGIISLLYPRQTGSLTDPITFDYSVSTTGSYEATCDEESRKIVVAYIARVEHNYSISVCRYSQNRQTHIVDIADRRWLDEFGVNGDPISDPRIKVDKDGNCLLLYRKFDMGFWKLYGSYFSSSANFWTMPFRIDDKSKNIYNTGFDIFLDFFDNFHILYKFEEETGSYSCLLDKPSLSLAGFLSAPRMYMGAPEQFNLFFLNEQQAVAVYTGSSNPVRLYVSSFSNNVKPPVAGFGAIPTLGVAPLTVIFNDLSSGDNISSWLWAFGDGYTSTEQNPDHRYTQPGFYSVSLTVTNPAASHTLRRSDLINVADPGADTNCDGHVDLKDAIVSLQVLVGMSPGLACELNIPDVNGDNRIGLPEVIYVLQLIAR